MAPFLLMSPQKFVKDIPEGYTLQDVPENFISIHSIPEGFYMRYNSMGFPENFAIVPEDKIAVRLPDGRLVIPTVKGESSQ